MSVLNKIDRAKLLSTAKNVALIIVGAFVLAFGVGVFIIPSSLVSGGGSGIAIVVHRLLSGTDFFGDIPVAVYASVINWLLFALGYFLLGKEFAVKTLVFTIVYPVALGLATAFVESGAFGGFFDLSSAKYVEYGEVTLVIAAVFGGALVGAGCALTFLGGGTTGGTDIIAFVICKYFKSVKSSVAIFIIDALVVLFGMFVIDNLVVSLLGIVSAFVCAISVDKVFLGESQAFIAHIISDKYEQINHEVAERMQRTTTIIDAVGGYSGLGKKMVMVTFTVREYAEFTAIMSYVDKNAFVTVHRAHQIGGEGWTYGKGQRIEPLSVPETVEVDESGEGEET